MGKKKNLAELDDYEKGYIEAKMGKVSYNNEYDPQLINLKKFNYKVELKCKNKKQKEFLNQLKDPSKQICFGAGSAGSGKSYLSLGFALSQLKDPSTPYEKIIILVPTLQSCSSTLNIGLLKGDKNEKLEPFLEADSCTMEKILKNSGNTMPKSVVTDLIASGRIEFKLVNFARGITYSESIILINEAEGYNADEMLLLLTRLGENCKCIITGDEQQAIRKDFKGGSGMKYAIERISDLDEVSITTFTDEDIVRNPIIGKILDKWKN